MSGRRGHPLPPQILEKPSRGRCVTAICFSWKVLTCVVSHVTLVSLVVAYCIGGALLFRHLEQPHELKVKTGIRDMRLNVTNFIWTMTEATDVLEEDEWTGEVKKRLASFEKEILTAMKTHGWDGDENENQSQWTFFGALFYSIIVITTIGYGHISPRTDWGKVTTIFYAIVGIPLMLLCLSNIGDVMATSFRFIYWRVCCYVCTREPRRNRRSRPRSRGPSGNQRFSGRSQPPHFRRSMKISPRSADSGFGNYEPGLSHAYSDPELRSMGRMDDERDFYRGAIHPHHHHYHHQHPGRGPPPRDSRASRQMMNEEEEEDFQDYDQRGPNNRNSRFGNRQRNRDRFRDRHTVERERNIGRSKQQFDSSEYLDIPTQKRAQSVRSMRSPNNPREMNRIYSQTLPTNARGRSVPNTPKIRAKSVDPRSSAHYEDVDDEVVRKTPILCNRYAIDELDRMVSNDHHHRHQKSSPRAQSMPRPQKSFNEPPIHVPTTPHTQRRGSLNAPMQSRFGNRLELPEVTQTHRNHTKPSQQQQQQQRRSSRYDEFEEEFDEIDGGYDDLPMQVPRERDRRPRRGRQQQLPPSPRIMSPMGFAVHRQHRIRPVYDDDDSYLEEEWDYGEISPKDRPVPIWLCVFLVVSYILAGAFLFHQWEDWTFLDSAYFCFITLTTIGFGDFVPARGVKENSQESIALCSLYLLFGIALLAMSFNLVQEEFIANVKEVARRLGILKEEEDDD